MDFLPSYIFLIAISFLVSLVTYIIPREGHVFIRWFPPYLLATFFAEAIGSYLGSIGRNNVSLYNYFSTFEFWFYLWMISLMISQKSIKRTIRLSSFCYVALAVGNIHFFQGTNQFHTITYSLGCLLIVVACIYYFLELFRLPTSIKLKNNPRFWICSGLLFFYCSSFPLYALINFWGDISPLILTSFQAIVTILNIFLYSLFTIAFVCNINQKYTSSRS